MDLGTLAIILISCGATLYLIINGIKSYILEKYTHTCTIKVISRKTGYEYRAVKWRDYKGMFLLYIYNYYPGEYEWISVFHFENSEKIIKQLTNAIEK